MNIKKRLLVMFLSAFVLVGCGSSNSDGKTTITIWHTFTEEHDTMLNEIINDFNEYQSEYKIVATTNPNDGFAAKVYEATSNGTGPDIVMLDASTGSDYVEAGLTIDFNDYLDDSDYKDRVSVGTYNESTGYPVEGLHCLAIQSTGPILYYNKTIYDELGLVEPSTFEILLDNSKVIYDELGIVGFSADSIPDLAISLIKQSGNEFINTDSMELDFGSDDTIEWLEMINEGVSNGYIQLNPTTGEYNSGDMSAKVLASYAGSSAGLSYVNLGNDELACVPYPQLEEGTNWIQEWNRNIFGFKSNDEVKNQGIADFAKFFTNTENNEKWTIAFGGLSPYNDVVITDSYKEYVSGNIALQALLGQSEYSASLPIFRGNDSVRIELEKMITRSATNLSTASEALKEAINASTNIIK